MYLGRTTPDAADWQARVKPRVTKCGYGHRYIYV
jgi:hypothetical protein